jgi:hypothetical protein
MQLSQIDTCKEQFLLDLRDLVGFKDRQSSNWHSDSRTFQLFLFQSVSL